MNFYYLGLEEGGGRQKDFQISILFLYLKTKAKWIKKHARISILVYVIHIKTKSYADGFCLWENSHKHVILHNGRINYLEPMAPAWPGLILLPPRWDLSPLQRFPPFPPPPHPTLRAVSLTIRQYPLIHLDGERHCEWEDQTQSLLWW